MRLLLPVLLLVCALPAAAQSGTTAGGREWLIGGDAQRSYALTAEGSASDSAGARLSLRSVVTPPKGFAAATASRQASAFRGGRVRIAAELRSRDVALGASLWLRVDGPENSVLGFDNASDRQLRGSNDWTEQSIVLDVPADAQRIVFGVLLQGAGEVEARRVRLVALPALAPDAPISPSVRQFLDSALAIVRARSVWRDTVSWDVAGAELYRRSAGATRTAEVYAAVRGLLARLGDHHSFLLPPDGSRRFTTGGAQNRPAEVRRIARGAIGYVIVPAYSGADRDAARAFARRTRAAIRAASDSGACGWVVDLRDNTGGNMWPMLAGLEPLLGDGPVGSFVYSGGESSEWTTGGQLPRRSLVASRAPRPASAATVRAERVPVAVLTGPRTASSGEAVAVAFRGRPNSRAFGRGTAGVPTANSGFPLPDRSMLFVTTSVDADRTGRRYDRSIEPDEKIASVAGETSDDPALAAATKWLARQRACAAAARR